MQMEGETGIGAMFLHRRRRRRRPGALMWSRFTAAALTLLIPLIQALPRISSLVKIPIHEMAGVQLNEIWSSFQLAVIAVRRNLTAAPYLSFDIGNFLPLSILVLKAAACHIISNPSSQV